MTFSRSACAGWRRALLTSRNGASTFLTPSGFAFLANIAHSSRLSVPIAETEQRLRLDADMLCQALELAEAEAIKAQAARTEQAPASPSDPLEPALADVSYFDKLAGLTGRRSNNDLVWKRISELHAKRVSGDP